jgi:[ribosomal protein S18]-alanine N-acetyltransferase
MSVHLRPLTADDAAFLREALYQAIFVPPGEAPPPRSLIDQPELAQYISGFGSQVGDVGVAALIEAQPIGVAWVRLLHGYGYVDDETPELSIAVLQKYQGQGVGTRLLVALFDQLRLQYNQVSLSVQTANPAHHLYQRLGFQIARIDGDSRVMVRRL